LDAKIAPQGVVIAREFAEQPKEKAWLHLLNGFKTLSERKGDLYGETTKAFVTCAQKLIPTN
jgi:hypothetical protein